MVMLEEEKIMQDEKNNLDDNLIDTLDEDSDENLDDDFDEDDPQFMSLKVAMIFVGMLIVAGIICALLWMGTHRGQNRDAISENSAEESFVEETLVRDTEGTMTDEQTAGGSADENSSDARTNGTGDTTADSQTTGDSQTAGDSQTTGDSQAAGDSQPAQEPVSGTTSMNFTAVSDSVTAKDVTNLRSVPSTADTGNVVGQLKNGESLSRTGVNDTTGWSRLDYNGQTVYAVTQYLTTDLTYKTPVKAGNPNRINTQDGRVIIFVDCDDNVTPKEYVNLRTEPSTSQGNATARCQISNGTSVHRTGYSPDSGWSRVEYNGEILYVVSSMVYTVE